MQKRILTLLVTLSLTISVSFACDIHGKSGFAPENNLRISTWDKATNGMTKERFLAIVKRVSDVYAPIIASKGAKLEMNNDWDDSTVNASADQKDNIWQVNMFGGLARHPLTTDDGFMLVVCHELGHHIGGFPNYGGDSEWASNEGQADYFGSLKCMKRVLEKDDNIAIVARMTIDPEVTKQCQSVYKNESEVALCQRTAMAGHSLGELLGSLRGSSKVDFRNPDRSVVMSTNNNHPAPQCRLDTYFSGALCDKPFSEDFSKTSPIPGACIKSDGYTAGTRSLCWYRPGAGE